MGPDGGCWRPCAHRLGVVGDRRAAVTCTPSLHPTLGHETATARRRGGAAGVLRASMRDTRADAALEPQPDRPVRRLAPGDHLPRPAAPLTACMLGPDDLRHVARVTISNYDRHADDFREGTKDHDVGQNVDALRSRLEGPGPFSILDLGCGPGRDLGRFRALGHEAIGLDGAARFVAMARAATGCDVWHQDFLALDLPPARFDGI